MAGKKCSVVYVYIYHYIALCSSCNRVFANPLVILFQLFELRIGAGCAEHGLRYSTFLYTLRKVGIL